MNRVRHVRNGSVEQPLKVGFIGLPDTLFVTPPNAVHSHHNRGGAMMRGYVVQDTGLHSQLRTTNFSWAD